MEKLFVQIFERKKWIIDQAQHQANLFDQHLASKLIIDGIVPPPWLQTSFLHSHNSLFAGVDKKFISGVEFPHSPLEANFFTGHCPNRALVADSREEFLQTLHAEGVSLNGDFDAGANLSPLPQNPTNYPKCALNCASGSDTSPISPQGQVDIVSENYRDPTLSLARLQRSKSRQRALESRNSVKPARYRSYCENKDDSIAGGISGSVINLLQSDCKDELAVEKPSNISTGFDYVEKENDICCEQKNISSYSYKITTFRSPGLRQNSLDVDNSSYVFSEGERSSRVGSAKCHSDQVNDQFDLSKPSPGNIKYCEETELGYCRSKESNFDNVEESRLQQTSLGIIEYCEKSGVGYCRSQEHNFDNAEQSELQQPSLGNIEYCEERLGYCKGQDHTFDNVEQSELQHSSFDMDNSSHMSPVERRLSPIGFSKLHSDQVKEHVDLSRPSSGNTECCDEANLEHCSSQEHNFHNAEQSGLRHSYLAMDSSSSSYVSLEERKLFTIGNSMLHSNEVKEHCNISRTSGKTECCEEAKLEHSRSQEHNFVNAELSGVKLRSPDMGNSAFDLLLPQIQVDSVRKEEYHKGITEAHSEKKCEVKGSLNGNTLSSADKSLQGFEDVDACSLLLSDEPSKQNISFSDQTSSLQFSHENLVENHLGDLCNASDLTVTSPCVPSSGEKLGNLEQQLTSSVRSKHQGSDSFECFISNISTECQLEEKSTVFKALSSEFRVSMSHNKHGKTEVQMENVTPASLGLRNEKLHASRKSTADHNWIREDDNQKPIFEIQRISLYGENNLHPNRSKSLVEKVHPGNETHSMQGTESPCQLLVEEDHSRFESNKRDTDQSAVLESQTLHLEEIFHLRDNEPLNDTGKSIEEFENGKFTHSSLVTSHVKHFHHNDVDEDMPSLEGFLMQAEHEQPCFSVAGINFNKFELSKSMMERADILEKLCKSASTISPLSSSFESFKLDDVPSLYNSLSNDLERMDLKHSLPMNDQNRPLKNGSSFLNEEVDYSPHEMSFTDCLKSFSSQSDSDNGKLFASPYGKFLDRMSSNSSSSGKQCSLNIELPCIIEENENTDEIADDKDPVPEVVTISVKRAPLADIIENQNFQVTASETAAAASDDRWSLESLNTQFSNAGACSGNKENQGNDKECKRKYSNRTDKQDISPQANGGKRVTRSSYNTFSRTDLSSKSNFSKEGPRFSGKESKIKNIVSNMTSFIPLVQQRDTVMLKGKRDIKVKAIEAAEAAKHLAEKKENERQMKKEALKLERARMEQEKLRHLELEKKKKDEERKKKEEERKKKEADMAAKKRQREEEEKKDRERKRMRVEEVRRRLREHGVKSQHDKDKKEVKHQPNDQKPRDKKGCKNETDKMEKEGNDILEKQAITEFKITPTTASKRACFIMDDMETISVHHPEAEVLKDVMENKISETTEEQSYQISPYKCSDDEDEDDGDDDDIMQNKFVPSWASKDCLAPLFASQQKVNPEVIFPPESFCNITEVLLPRKHQFK